MLKEIASFAVGFVLSQMEDRGRSLAEIGPLLCTGYEICAKVYPRNAIFFRAQILDLSLRDDVT